MYASAIPASEANFTKKKRLEMSFKRGELVGRHHSSNVVIGLFWCLI